MAKGKVALEGGFYVVRGRLDEHFDYGPLEEASAPVRINMKGVENANSLGVRRFLYFVERSKARGLEFHECSMAFMDMINTFPGCLGHPQDPEMIKSISLIYRCGNCLKDEGVLMVAPVDKLDEPDFPRKSCGRCGTPMASVTDGEDLFTYLAAGD